MMVQMWHSILESYIDDAEQLQQLSLHVQRVCYGFVSQTLLVEPEFGEWVELKMDILKTLQIFT